MVTGEQFITDENSDKINNVYSPFTVDMETAAIAHVCYVNQTPFISIRTITDTPKQRGLSEVEKNCKNGVAVICRICQRIADGVK